MGNLGVTVGHEFGHALDREGIQYNPFGDHGDVWLSERDHAEFVKSVDAIIAKYEGAGLACSRTNPLSFHINGTLVINEAIADHIGLKVVFHVLKNRNEFAVDDARFSMFTKEQLFFISFANFYCKDKSVDWYAEEFNEAHPTSQFRVNIALQNLPEFAETFQCPVGTIMNPTDKFSIW